MGKRALTVANFEIFDRRPMAQVVRALAPWPAISLRSDPTSSGRETVRTSACYTGLNHFCISTNVWPAIVLERVRTVRLEIIVNHFYTSRNVLGRLYCIAALVRDT
jgi:hypothetical protein